MLKSLYTLSEKCKNKKIVIYGVNRSSVVTFAKLVLNNQVNVNLFWDADDRFTGKCFVNRQIINTNQLQQIKDVIVIIPDAFEKQEIQKRAGKRIDVFYIDEILDLNDELRNKKIYIYGIGYRGKIVYDTLLNKEIEVEGVCTTTIENMGRWRGKEVLSVCQIEWKDNCSVILATDIEQYKKEMLEQIAGLNIEKYINFFMIEAAISEGNFFQVINLALSKHKELWLYGSNNESIQYLQDILMRYQINITKIICDENIFELEYEDINNISVIVVESNEAKMQWACDTLDSMGFGLEYWNYAATGLYTRKLTSHITTKIDVLIGNSTFESERYPGYVVYGDEKKAKVKIMILGGSTSTDGQYRTVSWVKFFYEKLLAAGCNAIIFNGSVCGHGIADEFLHMIRDIEPLKPDLVISFSGVNNTYHRKTANQFNTSLAETVVTRHSKYISGIKSDETPYDFWCRISKLMKLIAAWHGAKAYSFLQPMMMVNEKLDLIETGMFDYTEHTKYIRNFRDRALEEKDKTYVNLLSIFDKKDKIYIDHCHYSTKANEMIAERVFEVVKQDIMEFVTKII